MENGLDKLDTREFAHDDLTFEVNLHSDYDLSPDDTCLCGKYVNSLSGVKGFVWDRKTGNLLYCDAKPVERHFEDEGTAKLYADWLLANKYDEELTDIDVLEDEDGECVVSADGPRIIRFFENRHGRMAPDSLYTLYDRNTARFVTDSGNYKGIPLWHQAKYYIQDLDRLAGLETGDWCYIGVEVVLKLDEEVVATESVWSIESDDNKSIDETMHELADQIIGRLPELAGEAPERAEKLKLLAEGVKHE